MDESDLNQIILRDFNPEMDEAYIYASWRNNSFYSSYKKREETSQRFFKKQSRRIKHILESARIKIACFPNDPITIIGYSVSRDDHLDWVYIKEDYREIGIGKLLMPKNLKTVTEYDLTKIGKVIVDKKNLKTIGEEEHGRNCTIIQNRQTH